MITPHHHSAIGPSPHSGSLLSKAAICTSISETNARIWLVLSSTDLKGPQQPSQRRFNVGPCDTHPQGSDVQTSTGRNVGCCAYESSVWNFATRNNLLYIRSSMWGSVYALQKNRIGKTLRQSYASTWVNLSHFEHARDFIRTATARCLRQEDTKLTTAEHS